MTSLFLLVTCIIVIYPSLCCRPNRLVLINNDFHQNDKDKKGLPADNEPQPPLNDDRNYAFVLDINEAGVSDFALLPGIGPKLGEEIVRTRSQMGRFEKTTDLLLVRGIGSKKFAVLEPFITTDFSNADDNPPVQ